MPYSRKELVDLRNISSQQQSLVGHLIPKELRREDASMKQEPVIPRTTSYSRQQLLAIRDHENATVVDLPMQLLQAIPDDLKKPPRFRCDSNCATEQHHEQKQVLKYTRQELIQLRASLGSSCAIEAAQAAAQFAPEIFFRSLGR